MREYWERYLEVRPNDFWGKEELKKIIWAKMWFNFEAFIPMMSPQE